MKSNIYHFVEVARPWLWVKNLGLLLPVFLAGKLFDTTILPSVLWGIISFCLLSSSNYILNDIIDAAKDKTHPLKRHRPIANNILTVQQAMFAAISFGFMGLLIAFFINQMFFLLSVLFVLIHHLSYFYFRKMSVLDVLAIGSGYLLRIMAGEQAAGITMSVWLFLAVLSGSLLMAIGKRRHEFSMVKEISRLNKDFHQDDFIYSEKILDSYVAVFASSTFIAYTYFTFLTGPTIEGFLFKGYAEYLLQLIGRKWMMVTVPFVLYGIMRYLQLVYSGKGLLAKVLANDYPLLLTGFLWVLSLLLVVYGIGG
jgi:hypothetical protein